jgi:S-adenosylmethionine:tRNA ribosyltransferase-isomerase
MKATDFDYYLPKELIAQNPSEKRDESRLMIINRNKNNFEDKTFKQVVKFFEKDDLLVLNNSRVIPARFNGYKSTGARVEVVLLEKISNSLWKAIVRPGGKIKKGNKLFLKGLTCLIQDHCDDSTRVIKFLGDNIDERIHRFGKYAIPPYINSYPDDPERYQTVYCEQEGSVAAPTAGLHFTEELLNVLRKKGVNITYITLHVGLGTFRPVKVDEIENHRMHREYYSISKETSDIINYTKRINKRVIAVGTTTVRTLESVAQKNDGLMNEESGFTDIFIYPGFKFNIIDGLITNFHLPKSTLLMLVSALAGREKILNAYRNAIEKKYRFFSFGDACLII